MPRRPETWVSLCNLMLKLCGISRSSTIRRSDSPRVTIVRVTPFLFIMVIIVHDNLISIPLSHFEWGYPTKYVRFVGPQLATDAIQPDQSQLLVNFDEKKTDQCHQNKYSIIKMWCAQLNKIIVSKQ